MLVDIGVGRRVFVDDRGPGDAPAVLYLHGGPGQGSYEFMAAQGDRLAGSVRVIGLDQRGVLRSDPLDGATLTIEELAGDCDRLRRALGIDRWVVLAQSFGGLVAVRYAAADPGHVAGLILECATLDPPDSAHSLLTRAAALSDEAGRADLGDQARAAAAIEDPAERWAALRTLWPSLGDSAAKLYFVDQDAARWFAEVCSPRSGSTPRSAPSSGRGARSTPPRCGRMPRPCGRCCRC